MIAAPDSAKWAALLTIATLLSGLQTGKEPDSSLRFLHHEYRLGHQIWVGNPSLERLQIASRMPGILLVYENYLLRDGGIRDSGMHRMHMTIRVLWATCHQQPRLFDQRVRSPMRPGQKMT